MSGENFVENLNNANFRQETWTGRDTKCSKEAELEYIS